MVVKRSKALHVRAYPTASQEHFFINNFGCCRYVYNFALDLRSDSYKKYGKSLFYRDTNLALTDLKKSLPWLKMADSAALQMALRHCDTAFQKFFKHEANYPKHKTRKSRMSYTTPMNGGSIKIGKNYISLPKVGKVKVVFHQKLPEDYVIKSATISKEKDGSYYISLTCEYMLSVDAFPYCEDNVIGLDYKSDGLFKASDDIVADMPSYYRNSEKRLCREQYVLSHMIESHIIGYNPSPKGGRIPVYDRPLSECKNIQKQRRKVAKLHRHVANQRKDFLHKKSAEIANRYDGVCVETLNMRSMANKGFGNGKATMDNGYGMFLEMLSYKLYDQGKPFVKVGKWFPSSQICHCCGYQNPEVKNLNIRTWTCPNCETTHDRDYNAAINIKYEGLRILKDTVV